MPYEATHALGGGGRISGPAEVVKHVRQHLAERERSLTQWATSLITEGVKAAHPDDGWVDRSANTVHLCYPRFNHHPRRGDLIALGTPEQYRLVRVTDIRAASFQIGPEPYVTYTFEEAG